MKKSFTLFLVLLCLAVGGMAGLAVWVSRSETAVEVTQTTLQGDREAARGLTITTRTQLADQLFWDTTFPAPQATQAQTKFRFYSQAQDGGWGQEDIPKLQQIYFSYGTASPSGLDLEEENTILRPAVQVARTMGANQTRMEKVVLADWLDFFPMQLQSYFYYEDYLDSDGGLSAQERAMGEFFSIPIPREIALMYTVTTDSLGRVTEVVVEDPDMVWNWISWNTASAAGEEGWFFILDSWLSPQEQEAGMIQLDLSHIRDGYGVYYIPIGAYGEGTAWSVDKLDARQIQTVYALPQGERTVGLHTDGEGRLLLFTAVGESWYLNVLDRSGRQLLQRMELGELGSGNWVDDVLEGEDFLLVCFSQGEPLLLTREEGDYGLKMALEVPESGPGWEINRWQSGTERQPSVQWDGRRLALLEYVQPEQTWDACTYCLTVWQDGAVTYQGRYSLSFNRSNLQHKASGYMVGPSREQPILLQS